MGYMGLKHWGESDAASGAYGTVIIPMLKALSKEIKCKEKHFNTGGPENVAMIIEDGLLDTVPDYYIEQYLDYKLLLKGLKKAIEISSSKYKDVWGDEQNRKEHHNAYKRMEKNVKKFLTKKQIDFNSS